MQALPAQARHGTQVSCDGGSGFRVPGYMLTGLPASSAMYEPLPEAGVQGPLAGQRRKAPGEQRRPHKVIELPKMSQSSEHSVCPLGVTGRRVGNLGWSQ